MAYFKAGAITAAMLAIAAGALVVGPDLLSRTTDSPKNAQSDRDRAVTVITEPVSLIAERTRIEAVGTSQALRSVTLYPATSGKVVTVNFSAGQRVAAGEVLVELDDRDAALALELAEVEMAEAERLLNRYQNTRNSAAFSPSVIDETRTTLETARISRDRAQVALDDRAVEAPFAGHVGITEIDPGDRIQPDTAITTLDDRSTLLVSFEIPELFLNQIENGQAITVSSWARQARPVEGRIVQIGSRIDPTSRTFTARAEVPNTDDRLRPGMSFRMVLDLEGPDYPLVREVSVQWGGDGAYVWAIRDDTARRVPVDIVQRREGRVLVDGELPDGMPVVVEGVQRMREGLAVNSQNADPAPPTDNPARSS